MTTQKQNLYFLLEQPDWDSIRLGTELIKSFGYESDCVKKSMECITHLHLQEFLPDFGYHRFGCTLIDKFTFELIYQKLNEFYQIPFMEVEVSFDQLFFKNYIQREDEEGKIEVVDLLMDAWTSPLYYALKASFEIGTNPLR